MLVLSRKKNEAIIIGDKAKLGFVIKVVVVEIRGDKVRLGIEAPSDVPAHRQEVYEAIYASVSESVADHNATEFPDDSTAQDQ